MTVVLLGPQWPRPTLGAAMAAAGATSGTVATITAGWQEREADDQDLDDYLEGRAVNLELHRRAEQVFAADPELAAAYRARQERLQKLQEIYRVRLDHLNEAAAAVSRRTAADPALQAEETRISLEEVRELDYDHLRRCRRVHAEFEERLRPAEREAVARHRREVDEIVIGAGAVAVAGGHVAVLLNRLELFGVSALVGERPLFAWSAGAMAVTERVVLFHDSPPQGPAINEILGAGLGLCPDIVALPDPRHRLALDDQERVARFAARFAPAACVALDHGAWVLWDGARFTRAAAAVRLDASGQIDAEWPS